MNTKRETTDIIIDVLEWVIVAVLSIALVF